MMQKTYVDTHKSIKRNWHLVDAKGQVLGKVAVQVATKLLGKHKPTYTPHMDNGDFVVVINASEVEVTGNKEEGKIYYHHSGFPGGLKHESFGHLIKRNPKKVIELAVKGMLPKNKLRDPRIARLKIFAGNEHTYTDKFATK